VLKASLTNRVISFPVERTVKPQYMRYRRRRQTTTNWRHIMPKTRPIGRPKTNRPFTNSWEI